MTRLAAVHGAVNLAQGYPDFSAPQDIKQAAHEAIDADINQFAGAHTANRLVLTLGRFAVTDIFDTNQYANNGKNDFLNWSFVNAGTFDYASDGWGFTYGAAAEWYQGDWTVRGGLFDLTITPAGGNSPAGRSLDPTFDQFEMVGEIERLAGLQRLDAFIIPKAERVADIAAMAGAIAAAAGDRAKPAGMELLIETALGLVNVDTLAAAHPFVCALHLGVGDFAASIGARSTEIGASPPGYRLTGSAAEGTQDVPLDLTWQKRLHAAEHGERHTGMNAALDARCRQPGQRRRCLTEDMHEFDRRCHQRPLGSLGVIAGAAKALDEAP